MTVFNLWLLVNILLFVGGGDEFRAGVKMSAKEIEGDLKELIFFIHRSPLADNAFVEFHLFIFSSLA